MPITTHIVVNDKNIDIDNDTNNIDNDRNVDDDILLSVLWAYRYRYILHTFA
jgi:hypothetical protein